MKRYDIKSNTQDYKIGESYIFLSTDSVDLTKILKRVGTIRETGITSDHIPYVLVELGGTMKKYATTNLSKTLYSEFYDKMNSIPDPSILGEVTIVRKPPLTAAEGDVTRVKGMPGEVTKVIEQKDQIGDVKIVKK